MDATDRPTFDEAFRRMTRAFRVRLKAAELEELSSTYYKLLEAVPLDAVIVAGKVCLTKFKRFPRAAEWLEALPAGTGPTIAADLRTMGHDEAREYIRAEGLRYQDQPCGCLTCQAAGVTALPLRFVPEFTVDGRDERAYHPLKQKAVTSGRWIHGDDLRRWWLAREACFASAPRAFIRLLRNPQIRAEREPGEEG